MWDLKHHQLFLIITKGTQVASQRRKELCLTFESGDTPFLEKNTIMMGKVAEVISVGKGDGELLFCLPANAKGN